MCSPSPCGPNSQCRDINGQAVCSCIAEYIGSPPTCRPECVVSAECPQNQACFNQKCRDPCAGTCGIAAQCTVINHSPICSCPVKYSGNPFVRCQPISMLKPSILFEDFFKYNFYNFQNLVEAPLRDETNPCQPSPCGSNAVCRAVGDSPSCSCLSEFIGSPPNCRPECVSYSDCPSHLACITNKCKDPCVGACGANADCRVVSHTPMCVCQLGFTGDPFSQCSPERFPVQDHVTPCEPNPCGPHAVCREQNGAGSCQCLPDYFGNPYEGCRPECLTNSDCPSNRACVNNKCQDPCPGSCGQNANCQVVNHLASCVCLTGYVGDPYRFCSERADERKNNQYYTNRNNAS